ncbi:MAG: filamentous hemagglutinin N-terminal domain-containing protein [Candidatus Omnitrophota bacterium]
MERKYLNITLFLLLLINFACVAFCLPQPNEVVSGSADFSTQASSMEIVTSDKAIINYDSFDIAEPESVRFIQPSSSSCVLNRVITSDPSEIFGSLSANGNIFLINPNGILFGPNSRVDTGSLIASTLDISNENFLNEKYSFLLSGDAVSSITNQGQITAADTGHIGLISPKISNEGLVKARLGNVALASGEEVTLDFKGDGLLNVAVEKSVLDAAINNSGAISADGGTIILTAEAASDVCTTVINQEGILEANSLIERDGEVILTSEGEGIIQNKGTIDVSAADTGVNGGNILMKGSKVGQFGQAHADAIDGDGGSIELYADDTVALSSGSLTTANAGSNGTGGKVIAYSPGSALFRKDAKIEVKGGAVSGDGGFVEVSGKEYIEVDGTADRKAPNGEAGLLLIDPTSITINDGGVDDPTWTGNDFAPTGAPRPGNLIDIDTLEAHLDNGHTTITTTSGQAEAGDITLNAGRALKDGAAGGSNHNLTLTADDDIVISSAITFTGTGNITLDANDAVNINANITTTGGDFTSYGTSFSNAASIKTNGGDAAINNTSTVTIGGIGIDTTGAQGGDISFSDPGSLWLSSYLVTDGGDITVDGGGDIIITGGGTRTLDTETGSNNDAGDIDLGASNIYAFIATNLSINALTNANLNSGDITLGLIDNNAGANTYINDLTVLTDREAALDLQAVTTTGAQDYCGNATLHGDLSSNPTAGTEDIEFLCPITLAADIEIKGIGAGNTIIALESYTIDGAFDLTLTPKNAEAYISSDIGSITPLTSLTINNSTQVDLADVTTTGSIAVTGTNIDLIGETYESTTAGSITFTGAVDLDAAGDITVQTAGNLGTDDIIFTSTIDGAQDIILDSGAGDLNLGADIGATTPLSSFTASSDNDITIDSITTTNGISITSNNGSILDGNGAADNITAGDDCTLWANEVVGDAADPIDVDIDGGQLSVYSGGQVGGVSVTIEGTVLPSNSLHMLNDPPGSATFNGQEQEYVPPTVPVIPTLSILSLSQLNPYLANEMPLSWRKSFFVDESSLAKRPPYFTEENRMMRLFLRAKD